MKNVLCRNAVEYSILIAMNAMAIVIGLHHPIPIAVRHHPILGKYSMLFIFVHNTAYTAAIFLGSALTGGLMGAVAGFLNALSYGESLHFYMSNPVAATFPWGEIMSLMIATQVGGDIFWSVWKSLPFSSRGWLMALGLCLTFLAIAAYMEGGLLHV